MLGQDHGKIIHNAPQHCGIVLLRRRLLRKVPKSMEPGMEGMMLLHILLHQPGLLRYPFDIGEEYSFLVVVVVLNGLVPAAAVEKEVFDVGGFGNVGGLVVDGV